MFSPHPDSIKRLVMKKVRMDKIGLIVWPPVRVKTMQIAAHEYSGHGAQVD